MGRIAANERRRGAKGPLVRGTTGAVVLALRNSAPPVIEASAGAAGALRALITISRHGGC